MKKLIAITMAALLMTTPIFAAQVEVNGNAIEAQAVIVDSRTLVPVRGVFEELGYDVKYEPVTKTATLTRGDIVVTMTAGNTYFTVGDKQITPEVPQQIIDSHFMLPLRAVGESIGATVGWDAETKTASINLKQGLKVVPFQDFATSDGAIEVTTK